MDKLAERLNEEYNKFFKTEERVPKLLSNEKLKNYVRKSEENAKAIYRALCEVFTWRYSGGIVSEIKGEGDYCDYYCSGGEGGVKNRKVWKLLKKSDLNVLDGNYTWTYILCKTVWKVRNKRLHKLFDTHILLSKTKDKDKADELIKKIKKIHKKLGRKLEDD